MDAPVGSRALVEIGVWEGMAVVPNRFTPVDSFGEAVAVEESPSLHPPANPARISTPKSTHSFGIGLCGMAHRPP
ncbi:MAG: hypothetical protein BZY88_13190 [SAR202 cluster bacterium Io17-Chloro-G9]|nr:MAG: hypothetical protein BZY88_13190 [SAR202 cluster bacterium Io17-Chloro-G9]